MEQYVEDFLSKPFPQKDFPLWIRMIIFYPQEERDLLVRHWYKSFANYYDQLQRSNYFRLDDYLWKYRNNDMPQFRDLEFLYAFNDYQLCHVQGVEIEDAFDGPVPFFGEGASGIHAMFAQLYRLIFDHGALKAVDTLRYYAARTPLVQIRRLCQNYMIKCIDDNLPYCKYGVTEWIRIIEDDKTVSPLSPDILPSDTDWLRRRCISFGLAMMDQEQGGTAGSMEAQAKPGLRGLLNCAEKKKEEIVSVIGEYLQKHHSGNDVARLVIALRECMLKDEDTEIESGKPLLTYNSFSYVYKALIDEFPSYGIVQYNTANEANNKLNLLWCEYKSAPELKKGKGKTAERTYLRDMEHINAIKNFMQKFQKILSD